MVDNDAALLRIMPSQPDKESGYCLTRGTKVMLGDREVKGVTKVVITGEPNDIWRAKIECLVSITDMPGMAWLLSHRTNISWWRRVLLRLAGV